MSVRFSSSQQQFGTLAGIAEILVNGVNGPSTAVLHALYVLAEHPALQALAARRTSATRLDGRACAMLYRAALERGELDVDGVSAADRDLIKKLGVCP